MPSCLGSHSYPIGCISTTPSTNESIQTNWDGGSEVGQAQFNLMTWDGILMRLGNPGSISPALVVEIAYKLLSVLTTTYSTK